MSPTRYASSQIKDTLARAVCRKHIGASTSNFLLGDVRCQGVTALPSPLGTLRWIEYPYPPSRARQILQCHWETRKQPHERPEQLRSGLYKWHPGPPGGPFVIGPEMEKVCYRNLDREMNIGLQSFDLGHLPLRQAPWEVQCSHPANAPQTAKVSND